MLSSGRFNRLLTAAGGVGQRFIWLRASLCPCRNLQSGQALPSCPICGGKGVTWGEAQVAWAGMAGMKSVREWAAFGMWESGDVVLSIPSNSPFYSGGEFDRVIMLDSTEPFDTIFVRGSERQTYPVVSIDTVWWIDPTTKTRVNGPIPPVAPDGLFFWAPSLGTENSVMLALEQGGFLIGDYIPSTPVLGTQYSMRGRKRPEYFIYRDFPVDRAHYGGQPLPRRVVMRRFDLFGR